VTPVPDDAEFGKNRTCSSSTIATSANRPFEFQKREFNDW